MPKLKTKSGAKKRFRFTGTGKAKRSPAFKRHNLRKRPQKMKRKARGMEVVHKADQKKIHDMMPYAKRG